MTDLTDTAKELTEIYAPLDPGIQTLVELLRDWGHNTVSSCEGGKGHACHLPTVIIKPDHVARVEQSNQRIKIADLLIRGGYHGFGIRIFQENYYQNKLDAWNALPWQIRVQLWAKPE